MTAEHELEVARQQLVALQEEVARLRARAESGRATAELRGELVTVGAAAALSAPDQHGALLEQIVRTAMHVLRARAGSLYLLDAAREELVFEVALGDQAAPLRGLRLPLGQGMASWVAATGQAIAVADVQQDPRWAEEIGRTVGYAPRTMLALPLLLGDRVIGVLQLLDQEGGQPFSTGDMTTLGLFAQQAAVTIDQSRAMRSVSALLRAVLANSAAPADLVTRAAAFVADIEESAEYRDMLRLAELLGEVARHNDASRQLGLDLIGAIVNYLRAQP